MKVYKHHHIGKRPVQEDSLGFTSSCYLICDGVGGNTKGEVASNYVVNQILNSVKTKTLGGTEDLQNLIKNIQLSLNENVLKNPELEGMGTTLVGLFLIEDNWFVAHIGDSRLYWFKPKEKQMWRTSDHSFVDHLVKMKEITRQASRNHPRRNEINRAIMGNKDGKTVKLEIQPLHDFEKGDLLLLCSDGITEVWSDLELAELMLDHTMSTEEKADRLFRGASETAQDNNTAFLIEVTQSNLKESESKMIEWIDIEDLRKERDQINYANGR